MDVSARTGGVWPGCAEGTPVPVPLEELEALGRQVASRLVARWGAVLDAPRCPAELVEAIDAEFFRSGVIAVARATEEAGAGVAGPAAMSRVLRGLAEVDGGIAATFLARVAAVLPWKDHEAPVACIDGWSAALLRGAEPDCIWAWGWRSGAPLSVCQRAGNTWRWELVPPEALECVEVHERMGLRSCVSAWVRIRGQERVGESPCSDDALAYLCARVAACWTAIGVARARAAVAYAADYAKTRYQGGALLAEHVLVQAMLGQALESLLVAEQMLEQVLERAGSAGAQWLWAAVAQAGHASEQAAHTAQQVLGGYGYLRDYPVERCLRDAKMAAVVAGVRHLVHVRLARCTWLGGEAA